MVSSTIVKVLLAVFPLQAEARRPVTSISVEQNLVSNEERHLLEQGLPCNLCGGEEYLGRLTGHVALPTDLAGKIRSAAGYLSLTNYGSSIVPTTILTSTSRRHVDHYPAEAGRETRRQVKGRVGFIILNDNKDAFFEHGFTCVPIEAGSLVHFQGDVVHNTVVRRGEVRMLGPFDLMSFGIVGGASITTNSVTQSPRADNRALAGTKAPGSTKVSEQVVITSETLRDAATASIAITQSPSSHIKRYVGTKAPESTKAPVSNKALPQSTNAPESVNAFVHTNAPESTNTFVNTSPPESTNAPEAVKAAESSNAPEGTWAPEAPNAETSSRPVSDSTSAPLTNARQGTSAPTFEVDLNTAGTDSKSSSGTNAPKPQLPTSYAAIPTSSTNSPMTKAPQRTSHRPTRTISAVDARSDSPTSKNKTTAIPVTNARRDTTAPTVKAEPSTKITETMSPRRSTNAPSSKPPNSSNVVVRPTSTSSPRTTSAQLKSQGPSASGTATTSRSQPRTIGSAPTVSTPSTSTRSPRTTSPQRNSPGPSATGSTTVSPSQLPTIGTAQTGNTPSASARKTIAPAVGANETGTNVNEEQGIYTAIVSESSARVYRSGSMTMFVAFVLVTGVLVSI